MHIPHILTVTAMLLAVSAAQPALAEWADDGYYYQNWDVKATISADNVWTIHEAYDVCFNEPRHGIIRFVDEDYTSQRNIAPDGAPVEYKYMRYLADVNLLSAGGADYAVDDSEVDALTVRFGSADYVVNGQKHYEMAYTFAYVDDRIDVHDYLFHNIIPSDIDTRIEHCTFDLTFEKPLPADIADRLALLCGEAGTKNLANVSNLVVTTTHISGEISNVEPFNSLTLYAELPEGYYDMPPRYVALALAIALYASTFLLMAWLLYQELIVHHDNIVESVEFYAPDDMDPAEVGKLIDNSADDVDLAALIPWLAQKGCLTITEVPASGFLSKSDLLLKRTGDKSYRNMPIYVQTVMSMLFGDKEEVYMSRLGDKHSAIEQAKAQLNRVFTGARSIVSHEGHNGMLMFLLILASAFAMACSSPIQIMDIDMWVTALLFWGPSFTGAWLLRYSAAYGDAFRSRLRRRWTFIWRFAVWAFIVLLFITYVAMSEQGIDAPVLGWPLYWVMVIGCYVCCELSGRLRHDTDYAARMKGRVLGFRNFIATAKIDQLRMLVDKDPSYFYEVLPYAMVLGLSKKWANLFDQLSVQPASWYSGTNVPTRCFGQHLVSSLSNSAVGTIRRSAVDTTRARSTGSSFGGGGFSGGGFSGGGGGRGGSRSW